MLKEKTSSGGKPEDAAQGMENLCRLAEEIHSDGFRERAVKVVWGKFRLIRICLYTSIGLWLWLFLH